MAYCVLVAGEHWKLTTGEHNMGTNHCSMEHVGAAFDALRVIGVPRSRIIVIAQVEERREWLRGAIVTGLPTCVSGDAEAETVREASRQIYRHKLAVLEQRCGGIIREGGADYDGESVNPETIFNVLTAALDDVKPSRGPLGPVVPRDASGVALMIYSHGCSHETASLDGEYWRHLVTTTPCDVCGKPHPLTTDHEASAEHPDHDHVSLRTNEWYIHLPHNAPTAAPKAVSQKATTVAVAEIGQEGTVDAADETANMGETLHDVGAKLYEGIAHSEHPHPYSLLYWQIVFKIYHRRFSVAPDSPILVLLNSCRSGGMSKFLEQDLVDRTYGVHDWPLFIMSSSQAERDAVVGGLWTSWFERLERLATEGGEKQEQGHIGQEGMAEFFEAVADEYNAGHTYDILNRIMSSWQIPANTDVDVLMQSLRRDCLSSAGVDYAALQRLIVDAGIQPRLNCVQCKRFGRGGSRQGPGGGLLCSGCEKAWAQARHTKPPTVPAHPARARDMGVVEQLVAVARQAEHAIARPWAWCGARSEVGKHSVRHFLLGSEERLSTPQLEQPLPMVESLGPQWEKKQRGQALQKRPRLH